jgi:hypothetical protein
MKLNPCAFVNEINDGTLYIRLTVTAIIAFLWALRTYTSFYVSASWCVQIFCMKILLGLIFV